MARFECYLKVVVWNLWNFRKEQYIIHLGTRSFSFLEIFFESKGGQSFFTGSNMII